MIYFDHNATTRIDDRVLEAMLPFLQEWYGNPSALYRLGRTVRSAVETARAQVAALVGVTEEQVIFTSGGTEANNLALQQVALGAKLVLSAIEHPSIMQPAQYWQQQGHDLTVIDVDTEGRVDQQQLAALVWNKGDLLSIQLANNETGVLQYFSPIAEAARAQGVIVHTDAVQAAGKMPVVFNALHVHLMSLSSHKIYGPKGSGALIMESSFSLCPLITGGGQEHDFRSGTENVAGIVGFGKAAELALAELDARRCHLQALRDYLQHGLQNIPGTVIFSHGTERLLNTVQFGIMGMDGEMLLMQLDKKGIAVSSGSACSSGASKPSAVLTAMGVPEALAKSALRVSLGNKNTIAECDIFIQQLKSLITN